MTATEVPTDMPNNVRIVALPEAESSITMPVLQGSAFNAFRNYAGAQLSFMFLNALESRKDGFEAIAAEVSKVILK